ncbi:MAG: Ig-like domain-containing protein, partial [Candidatus Dormibacteria bacterium]
YRMNPATCAAAAPILITFNLADLQRVADAEQRDVSMFKHPVVNTMVYDPVLDELWLTLSPPNDFSPTPDLVGMFRVHYTEPLGPGPATGPAHLAYLEHGCTNAATYGNSMNFLSYDPGHDSFWACDGVGASPSQLRIADGVVVPTCVTARVNTDSTGAFLGSGSSAGHSNWAVGAAGRVLYVQSEDDVTVEVVETATCLTPKTYTHRLFAEPGNENEQMVCDPFTYSAPSAVLAAPSALWIRDARAELVTPYSVDEPCPWPSRTLLRAPQRLNFGQAGTLCADLSMLGRTRPLANLPMGFMVDGKVAGGASTGADGTSCLDLPAGLAAGPHQIQAGFAGDNQFMPSQASSALTVVGPVLAVAPIPPTVAAAAAGPLRAGASLPPPNPPPTSTFTESPVPAQAFQSQFQSQQVTQAAVMPQQQTQRQVATQTNRRSQRTRMAQQQLLASRLAVGVMTMAFAAAIAAAYSQASATAVARLRYPPRVRH